MSLEIKRFTGVKIQSSSKSEHGAEVKEERPSDRKLSKMIGELMIEGGQMNPLHPNVLRNYSIAEWKADVSVRNQAIANKEGDRAGIINTFSHAVQRIKNLVTAGSFKTDKQLLENSMVRLDKLWKVLVPPSLNQENAHALNAQVETAIKAIKEADKNEAQAMVAQLLNGKNPADGVTNEMKKFRAQHKDNPVVALALLDYVTKNGDVDLSAYRDSAEWMKFASKFPSDQVLRKEDFIVESSEFFKKRVALSKKVHSKGWSYTEFMPDFPLDKVKILLKKHPGVFECFAEKLENADPKFVVGFVKEHVELYDHLTRDGTRAEVLRYYDFHDLFRSFVIYRTEYGIDEIKKTPFIPNSKHLLAVRDIKEAVGKKEMPDDALLRKMVENLTDPWARDSHIRIDQLRKNIIDEVKYHLQYLSQKL